MKRLLQQYTIYVQRLSQIKRKAKETLSNTAALRLQAWAFIIAREVEAPQRFQAIQSHRAAQAILHQQTQYVGHLLETAVVDEDDGRHLLRSSLVTLCLGYAFYGTLSITGNTQQS